MKTTPILWKSPPAVVVPPEFQQAVGGHPLVAETLIRRGVTTIPAALAFLHSAAYTPTPPTELPDLGRAADRLEQAIAGGERIGVWGDFDADGQTATAVLMEGLLRLGADAVFHLPVRAAESHGINIPGLQTMLDKGIHLLLTCDTGVSAHEAVEYAQARGIPVIITDHHTLPPTLPSALAVVNSRRLPEGHPLNPLCGVGVAYKLIEELYLRRGIPHSTERLLDLVAVGTVADVAPLVGENRYLVQRGLEILRTQPRLALRVLLETAGVNYQKITETQIGFVIGPRMNALGRLGDANPLVDFLLTDNEETARIEASRLEGLNNARREISDQVFAAAVAQLTSDRALEDAPALVLAHPQWPGGIIGIVAGRLAERYHKPTLLLSAPKGGKARGSARSVEGIDITAAIAENGELLHGFGGHPMAAGLSLPSEDIPRFRKALCRTVERLSDAAPSQRELTIDATLSLAEITPELVSEVERLAPFGAGNPELIFASTDLTRAGSSHMGKNNEHLKVIVRDLKDAEKTVLWWNSAGQDLQAEPFDLAYTVRASSFQGREEVSLEWVGARAAETQPAREVPAAPQRVVHDLRAVPHPHEVLEHIQHEHQPLVWAEGAHSLPEGACDRMRLSPHPALVLWSIPPGPDVLRDILATVSPHEVFVIGAVGAERDANKLITQVAGLLSISIDTAEGETSLAALAAATGQRQITVQKALEVLSAAGKIDLRPPEDGTFHVKRGSRTPDAARQKTALTALRNLLTETQSFQDWFREKSLAMLFGGAEE